MKTTRSEISQGPGVTLSRKSSPVSLGLLFGFMVAHAASSAPLIYLSSPPPVAEEARMYLGTIAVVFTRQSVVVSADKGRGQIRTMADGAGEAARDALEISQEDLGSKTALIDAAAGTVIAPFAAIFGAVRANRMTMPPETLAEAEQELRQTMDEQAAQGFLREAFVKTAKEMTRRRFVMARTDGVPLGQAGTEPADAELEIAVDEFRLVQRTSSDTSFALHINSHARLTRIADGAVLYDQPFEYRSGEALFIAWAVNHAEPLKLVAETGYRFLADRMVEQIFLARPDGPLSIGPGAVARNKGMNRNVGGSGRFAPVKNAFPAADSGTWHRVSALDTGSIGIFSTARAGEVALRHPVTNDEIARNVNEDLAWELDGLDKFPNPFISLSAVIASWPIEYYQRTMGAIQGFNRKRAARVETALMAVAQDRILHRDLGREVAMQLQPRTAQTVKLLPGPTDGSRNDEFILARQGPGQTGGGPAGMPDSMSAAGLAGPGIGMLLEIRILSAALRGGDGVNPPLALCVEARAVVLRATDGAEIYSFPVQYHSRKRSFTDWAAHDGRLFRSELEQCSHDLGGAMVDDLVACRMVAPLNGRPTPALAAMGDSR